MDKKFTVYKVHCKPSGKDYIGITNDMKKRFNGHWSALTDPKKKSVFHKAIRKYGKESFIITILNELYSWESACLLEQHYIKDLNTKIPNGYNMTDGGEGTPGIEVPQELRDRLSESHKGLQAGEKHGSARLTEKDVITIRKRYRSEHISSIVLSKEYGVRPEQISLIVLGKSWGHIKEGIMSKEEVMNKKSQLSKINSAGKNNGMYGKKCPEQSERMKNNNPTKDPKVIEKIRLASTGRKKSDKELQEMSKRTKGSNNPQAKFTEKDILEIREIYSKGGISQYKLAKQYNTDQANISCIVRRKTWAHI